MIRFHSKEIVFQSTVVQQKLLLLLLLFYYLFIYFLGRHLLFAVLFYLGGMNEKMESFNLPCSLLVIHCSFVFSPFTLVFKCGFLWPLETSCSADPFRAR